MRSVSGGQWIVRRPHKLEQAGVYAMTKKATNHVQGDSETQVIRKEDTCKLHVIHDSSIIIV